MPTEPPSLATIVAIDDNLDDLEYLQFLLARAGVRNPVLAFQCSQKALEYLRGSVMEPEAGDLPCGVITDGNMPVLDGFGVLSALRALPGYAEVKLIMVSGSERPVDQARAMSHGANAYFVKFPAPEELGRAFAFPSTLP